MLKYFPKTLGRILRNVKPGLAKIFYYDPLFRDVPAVIKLSSPAFRDGKAIPICYTSDGNKGSPPLLWEGVPNEAMNLVILIEDADSLSPTPLTHAIVIGLPGIDNELDEGEIKNYLPPDPLLGHGTHRYFFQIFALDTVIHGIKHKKELKEAISEHVVGKGRLIGTYERSKASN